MVFQDLFTPFLWTSLVLPLVVRRSTGTLLPYWSLPVLVILTLSFLYSSAVAYTVFLRPLFSSLKRLPAAPQPPVWQRLFKEPSAHHFGRWFREVPNNGMIRYYGILNIERVLITSPLYTRKILQTNSYLYEKQHAQKTHLERVGGRGLVWHEGAMHRYLRRALAPAFKASLLRDAYLPPIAQKTAEMLALLYDILILGPAAPVLDDDKQQSAVIEVDEIIHRTMFDIMGLVAFGPDMDFQSIARPEVYYYPLKQYRLAFKPSPSMKIRVYAAFFFPTWVVNTLPITFNFTTGRAINAFRRIGKNWIDRQKGQRDIAIIFHNATCAQEGRLSNQDLLEQFSMLQAGGIHSMSAATLSAIWWLAHPANLHIHRHLRDEIRTHISSSKPRDWLSAGTPNDSKETIFERCHYLNAVISEVLRLHPPFSWIGRTPNTWVEVGDTALPPGLSISMSPWAAHRDPTVWGPDASSFRPERWLPQTTKPSASSPPPVTVISSSRSLSSFGAGPRKCIGESLAKMEMQCLLTALFGQYEFQAVPGLELPGVTHQSTLALRSALRLRVTFVAGWD